jgi:hypothetical protein
MVSLVGVGLIRSGLAKPRTAALQQFRGGLALLLGICCLLLVFLSPALAGDGALDTTFGPASGPAPHVNLFNGEVKCGTEQSDGKIILGGDFTQMIEGPQVGHLARFSANGLLDNTFSANPGADGPIYAMQGQWPSDKFFIGGAFTTYKGVGRNRLARLNPDGSLDTTFNPGTGANDAVYAIAYNEYDHRAYIGGAFTTYNGVSRSRIARIMAGGVMNPATLMLLLIN